ncbi:MAG TPA: VWA domain-containing protein [candidate division Zixibacteria bacterium]|nr:VWA domain-containing protein [candidate division Zixibacteria bacterium]
MKRFVLGSVALLAAAAAVFAAQIIGPPDDQFDMSRITPGPLVASTFAADTAVNITLDPSSYPIIEMYVDVLDNSGYPIPGLTAGDFCVTQDGAPVPFQVTEVGSQGCPTAICLVIDQSGSMASYGAMELAKNAARQFVRNMDAFDRVALVPFSSCTSVLQDFTSDTTLLLSRITSLIASGSTALFDGIWLGEDITAPQQGARAVISFTDGGENNSDVCGYPPDGSYYDGTYADDSVIIVNKALAAGIPLYGITVGSGAWADPLIAFAGGSGGYYMHAPSAADIDSLYSRIKTTLCSRYLITFTSPDTVMDGTQHQVVVCQGGTLCTPCDTGWYNEPCPPVIVRTQATIDLEAVCQPAATGLSVCALVADTCAPFLSNVTLFWRYANPAVGPYNSAAMVSAGGNEYCYTIPGGLLPLGTSGIDYYVTASDGEATVSVPAANPQNYPYAVAICPNYAPEITGVAVDCEAGGDAVVAALITDTLDYVDHAVLFYRQAGDILYDSVLMANTGGSNWEGVIPSEVTAGWFDYVVRAWDNFGVMAQYGPLTDSCGDGDEPVPTNEWINVYCGYPLLNGVPLSPGDVIRAYDPDGVLCGMDVVRPDGSFGFMPIYREEPYNPGDQGAEPSDLITFFINGVEAQADPEVYWTANGDGFEVCAFTTCQTFTLDAGWHLISWNREWSGSIEDFFALLGKPGPCIEVILGFDRGAQTYDPDLPEFSTLHGLDYHFGYWFLLNCPITFDICGPRVDPTDFITMWPDWNLVSYWPTEELAPPDALASVYGCLMVAVGFDGGGLIHVPGDDPYNTLATMGPGFGYWLKGECGGTLLYPGWTGPVPPLLPRTAAAAPEVPPSRTWLSLYGSNLTLDGAALGDAVFEVFGASGVRCGVGRYSDGLLRFTPVYGYDATSATTVQYPKAGERLTLTVNGERVATPLVWTDQGDRVRLSALTREAGGALPLSYGLAQNYPNPFNPTTAISFTLAAAGPVKLKVINLLGQTVATLVDGPLAQGSHTVTWDASAMASGTYFYRLTAGAFTQTKKMVLLK